VNQHHHSPDCSSWGEFDNFYKKKLGWINTFFSKFNKTLLFCKTIWSLKKEKEFKV
jgi:hypothetical protein